MNLQETYCSLSAQVRSRSQNSAPPALLLAVSKTVEISDMLEVYQAGARDFGESRPQEMMRKAPLLPQDCCWHMIGHLQKNKVRQVLTYASWIHSVDSLELLERIETIAQQLNVRPKVLFEVNISGEQSKDGLQVTEVDEVLQFASHCSQVIPKGFMTMAPFDASDKELHEIFGSLRILRDQLEKKHQISLPELSMGMSHDYLIALEEGATIVRLGSSLFGERIYNKPV